MLERFSEEASRAVSLAGDEARGLGHAHIGTEHLLLGLVAERGSVASDVLIAAGASLTLCREKVVEALASRTTSRPAAAGDLPFSDRAARALDRASRLSLRMGSEAVHPNHVLLSVLDVEGTAGQVLRGLFIDPQAVRQALLSRSPSSPPSNVRNITAVAAPNTAAPLCGACGSSLERSLDLMETTVGSGASARQVNIFYCGVCGTAIGAEHA
jgi:ATP-dependent Clp protease ATP-binding subunit ClpA